MLLHILTLTLHITIAHSDDLTSWDIRPDTTATNYGPLTTQFTPPASCFTARTQAAYGYPSLVQGCEGPYGDACCPPGWSNDVYFSPGQCPSGYRSCTLPTTTQRAETTNICCPSGFQCGGQDYCTKMFNTISTMTYIDSTLSTEKTIYGVTASPIQIRYKASDSTVVPIATDSLKLPKDHSLTTGSKVGIGIGVPAGLLLVSFVCFLTWRYHKNCQKAKKSQIFEAVSSADVRLPEIRVMGDDPPPAYPGTEPRVSK